MTFELSAEQQALQTRARAFAAEHVMPVAGAIDHDAAVPSSLRAALESARLFAASAMAIEVVVATEELACSSAAVAIAAALDTGEPSGVAFAHGGDAEPAGLRGAPSLPPSPQPSPQKGESGPGGEGWGEGVNARTSVALAAVAVGIGRAALEEALAFMRASGDRPSGNADERPHWVLADAAAELDGARLLTRKAAQAVDAGAGQADASLAKAFAADAAQRVVDAALRVLGPAAYRRGTVMERLTRDARAIALVGGTGEEHRALVADLTLPA